jgi:hypothetical protein
MSGKFIQYLPGRFSVEGPNGEVVVLAAVSSQMNCKILSQTELVCGIEILIVLPVRPFHLAVMPWY